MLTVGLVGLPNVGKSTLFNALTAGQANVSNYPFTTIEPNVGVVAVPDQRLGRLAGVLDPLETTPSFIEFVDIAGLVEGASRGEGLGNQFLGNIRTVDAVAHVLRCFDEEEVVHVAGSVDPIRDALVIDTELVLADMELLQRSIQKREKLWKTNPRGYAEERRRMGGWLEALEAGQPLRTLDLAKEEAAELEAMGLLTGKPLILVANVSEKEIVTPPATIGELRARFPASEVVAVSAKIEWELTELDANERRLFAAELGLEGSGLDRLVDSAFSKLRLIRFYTIANRKLRAWEIERGTLAPKAAGKIHSDMERGFIRARVAGCKEMLAAGGLLPLQEAGKVRTEGKEYTVQDGDVIEFAFSPA